MKFLAKLILLLTLISAPLLGTTVTPVSLGTTQITDDFLSSQKRIAVGSDGFLRIVAFESATDGSEQDIRFIRCLNSGCTSTTSHVLYQTNIPFGPNTGCMVLAAPEAAIALGSDDIPRVAVLGTSLISAPGGVCPGSRNGHKVVGFMQCGDANCSTSTFTYISETDIVTVGVAVNSSGTASVVYEYPVPHSPSDLLRGIKISTCSGASCGAGVPVIAETSSNNCLGVSSLHYANDDTLRFVYSKATGCGTPANVHYWSNGTDTSIGTDGGYFQYMDMDLGADGNGGVTWGNFNDTLFHYVHCTNSTCATKTDTTFPIINVQGANSVVFAADTFARIGLAYTNNAGAFDCSVDTCTATEIVCKNADCTSSTTNVIDLNSGKMEPNEASIAITGTTVTILGSKVGNGSPIVKSGVLLQLPESAPDFTISATPSVQVLQSKIGAAATYTVTIAPLTGFTDDVALTGSGEPSGATLHLDPATVTGGTGTSTLTITLGINTTAGVYPITITGTSGSLVHNASVALTVYRQKPRWVSRQIVDLVDDNPGVVIPVRDKSGKIPFSYQLVDTPVAFTFQNEWVVTSQMVGISNPAMVYYGPIYPAAAPAGAPANVALPAYIQSITDSSVVTPSAVTAGTPTGSQGWFFIDSTYVSHFFDVNGTSGAALINDGSGYTLAASGSASVICQSTPCPTIVDVLGNVVANNNNISPLFRGNVGSYTDPTGVTLTAFAVGDAAQTVIYTDSMGLVALTAAETSANSVPPNGPLPTNQYTYTSPSGVQRFIVNYGSFYQSTNFGCPGVTEMPHTPVFLPVTVTLPDKTTYALTYEFTPGGGGDVTGRLASVKAPTGGLTRYAYSGGNNGVNCTDGSVPVLSVTTPDGGTWTYVHTLN